ncbi:TetR/AcrR family transcriptional regulator [Bacillus sp. EB600]|uniref:TetR/AcrR family transcriptional regulator n=1 Tax=Bacillus sp. EB600 TaxID=2806345 RepID=UPI00210BB015|nr:TetR/AcrR family transcriptional regulator [Bacillus sp. EB600]MCQ6281668.1 TetR/AcrR family transcriptional regulator [Bacillus sp. EB600]
MKTARTQKETKISPYKGSISEQIISGAMDAFTEIGYKRATVNDITTRANVGYGTFYHYFQNKQDLLTSLVDDLVNKVDVYVQRNNKDKSLYENMRNEAQKILEYYVKNRGILIALKEAVMIDRKFEESWLKISESLFKRIERDITGAMEKGYCRKVNVEVTIRSITCMFEGYGHYLMMKDQGKEDIHEVANCLTNLCYQALFKIQT